MSLSASYPSINKTDRGAGITIIKNKSIKNNNKKMKTEIFKNKFAFLQREDKEVNGVSEEFAQAHPDYEKKNKTNDGCWNCSGCFDCSDCSGCSRCSRCSRCSDCSGCFDCFGC